MSEEERHYREARRRVNEKKKFYNHLTTYLVMSAFFFVLNAMTSFGHWWFYWPMMGWGIGVAMQYFKVFGFPGSGLGSSEWEKREMEKELGRYPSSRKDNGRQPTIPAPAKREEALDLDRHLELRELDAEEQKSPSYRKDDLV